MINVSIHGPLRVTGKFVPSVTVGGSSANLRITDENGATATIFMGEDKAATVETVAQAVSDARRGLRRAFKLGLVLTVIGVVAFVVVKKCPKRDDQTPG